MSKPLSHYQQVKAVFQQNHQNRYAAFREALRILIPHEWRRRAVTLMRSWFGLKSIAAWKTNQFSREITTPPKKSFHRGDFYEGLTLLPHIPEPEVKAILKQSLIKTSDARPDIICFSIIDWSFRFQRPQQLMTQFAKHGHRVFYLNLSKFRSPSAEPMFEVREIGPNLYDLQIASRAPLDVSQSVIEGRTLELGLESLDQLRRAYKIDEAIGYVMFPSWGPAALEAQRSWGWRIIYDCMDEWENFPGTQLRAVELERELAKRCDLLVVTAQRLVDKWARLERPRLLARNATDYEFYVERCGPNELLSGVTHPIIGYYGAIADWFDVDLMVEVARLRPNYTFILLGGVFDVDVSRLRMSPNVKLLGQQPYETMPQYLYHFDVCLIPFKLNPITEATDPVKLYEYLSGGKPVVSVKLPELEPYRDEVYLAEGVADFAAKIDLALAEDNERLRHHRQELAQHQTWIERYQSIWSGLQKQTPLASVIIITYDNLALTKLCLESLFRNTDYPTYEVIVVDNKSSDGTPDYLMEMSKLHDNLQIILNDENYGFAKANNQGIEKSSGEYLVLLNNDTIVPRGWLSQLLRHLRDPQIGIVGPVTNFVGNEAKIEVTYRTWAEMEEFVQEYCGERDGCIADIYMLAMFCVAMRREVYDRVGPLDEQFGIGMFEDDDYSIRVKQQSYRVVCAADAFVHHFGQAAFGKLIRSGHYDRLFDENRQKFETKWRVKWTPHQNAQLIFKPHHEPKQITKQAE